MKKWYFFLLVVLLFSALYLYVNNSINVSSNTLVSNKKICWGLKREDNNKQPQFNKLDTDILDKYNGIYVGNPDKKYVYLTFDEGYENGYTDQILDILKNNNVCAAFFVTSDYLKTSPDLVKRIISEGHILGNHTNKHPSMPSLNSQERIREEIETLSENISTKYNYKMEFFRPPMGEFSEFTMKCTNDLGYITVLWSFAYDDWNVDKQKGEEYAKQKIMSNLHNGSIILLHAVSKDNANVLDYVIKEVKKQGYEFKSLKEFVR